MNRKQRIHLRMNKERRTYRINKKGQLGDQISVVLFLFLMIIVGGGIAMGAVMVFAGGYDFRAVDANLLSYEISNCMSQNVINDNFFAKFYEICGINKKVIEESYGLRICEGIGIDDCRAVNSNIKLGGGRTDFNFCITGAAQRSKDIGLCGAKEVVSGNKKYVILTTSNVKARAVG